MVRERTYKLKASIKGLIAAGCQSIAAQKRSNSGSCKLTYLLFAVSCFCFQPALSFAQSEGYLIEAEDFQFKGQWMVEKNKDCFAGKLIRITGGGGGGGADQRDSQVVSHAPSDAITVVRILKKGKFYVWVRSADYLKLSGQRTFQLSLNNTALGVVGKHGRDGYYWELAGSMDLDATAVMMRLHALSREYARCDAILLTADSTLNPNEVDRVKIGRLRKNPQKMAVETGTGGLDNILPSVQFKASDSVIASINNRHIRLSYLKSGFENKAIACKTEVKVNGVWKQFASNMEDHKLMLLSSKGNSIHYSGFFPSWDHIGVQQTINFNHVKYPVDNAEDHTNPFNAGEISDGIPVNASKLNDSTIAVQYVTKDNIMIMGYWHLPEQGYHMEVNFVCHPKLPGQYSIGLAAFQGLNTQEVTNILLPPMYQYKRIPEHQTMLLSSMMQQPFVMVEKKSEQGLLTAFISADIGTDKGADKGADISIAPDVFNNEWGSADYSPIGFSIKNALNKVQPVAFSPVMGMKDARVETGEKLERRFILGLIPAGVDSTLHYIDNHIFRVRDYRKQVQLSLTETLFNIGDLMNNPAFGGWSTALKGFYDIEGNPKTAPTVVQSAPLAVIANAIIARDEALYIAQGLPTIEYTLSRSGYRWAKDLVPAGYNKTYASLQLNPITSQFTTAYYTGLNRLLGGLNPWLQQIALPADTLRAAKGYSSRTLPWVEALAAYQLTGKKRWKEMAIRQANSYIQQDIYSNSATTLSSIPFYNAHFYAPWWDLIDLYEQTGEKNYLKAAKYGATQTLAGIRTYPVVADGDQIIHPGGKYEGNTTLWWKGNNKYRLGFPRVAGDAIEKKVPAWKVSPVGLGFEQPTTYFLTSKGKNVRPVYMSNWAPHLLRLFDYSQNPIYRTFARNAIIGRFSNYPGYYATGYTDIPMRDSFPYKGPDVSSIYYHHIPAHWAFTWDYLVSEFISASKHHIEFPFSKQEGFVWFNNRIYNGEGSMYDQKATLWMKRGLVEIDKPEINYITAISEGKFWLVMYNESEDPLSANVWFNKASTVKVGGQREVYGAEKKILEDSLQAGANQIVIPGKSIRAWAVETAGVGEAVGAVGEGKSNPQKKPQENAHANQARLAASPLQDGMKILDLGAPFGKVFLFRIRSPFGWDAVYGFAETGPLKNASLTITCNKQQKTVDAYPFECSFLKFNPDETIDIKVTASQEGKNKREKTVRFSAK